MAVRVASIRGADPWVARATDAGSAVLCAALMAATAWAVLAAGWVNGGGGAVVVAVTAVVEAALLARAAAPRIVVVIAAPLLGLAAIVPTTLAAMPVGGDPTLRGTALHYLQALVSGLASNQDWDFTVGLCAVLFLCGYWLAWTALREHRGVLAVVPLYTVLAVNVLNTHIPEATALPEAIAIGLSLAVIAGSHLSSLGDRWLSTRVSPLPGLRSRFAASVAVVAVLLTLAALLIPPLTTTDISARFFPGAGGGHNGRGLNGVGTASAGTISFNGSTQPGGSLSSHPRLVMVYTVDTSAPVYLSVVTDSKFAEGDWYPNQGDFSGTATVSFTGLQFSGGSLPRDRVPADGGVGAEAKVVHASILMQPGATGNQPLAPFTGEPDSLALSGIAYGSVDSRSTGLLTVDQVQLDQSVAPDMAIQSTATISTATADQLRQAGTAYPSFTDQYTQLDDDNSQGREAISNLARSWTAGAASAYDAALTIEQRLRDPKFFQYTLSPPDTPTGEWPIVYFLLTSHRGYCQYFASAMGAMLRSLGIPTRLVNGYGPGITTAVSGRSGTRQQSVSSSDAHTWVESYFPGYGWIPFEPTPPSAQGDYLPFARGAAAAGAGAGAQPPSATPGASIKPGFTDPPLSFGPAPAAARAPASGSPPFAILLAVLGGAVLLALAWLLWLLLPRSLTGVWRRLETVGAMSGLERRRSETHRAYAARFAASRPRAAPLLDALAEVIGRAEFSAAGAGPDTRGALRSWRRVLLATRPVRSRG